MEYEPDRLPGGSCLLISSLPKGVFRRHDLVVLILSCMIFLFRRHYNVMCDFFQQ